MLLALTLVKGVLYSLVHLMSWNVWPAMPIPSVSGVYPNWQINFLIQEAQGENSIRVKEA